MKLCKHKKEIYYAARTGWLDIFDNDGRKLVRVDLRTRASDATGTGTMSFYTLRTRRGTVVESGLIRDRYDYHPNERGLRFNSICVQTGACITIRDTDKMTGPTLEMLCNHGMCSR